MYNGNVNLVYSEERDSWNVIVDGEWYFEGTYEQAEKCAETFWFDDEEDYDSDEYEEDYEITSEDLHDYMYGI